MKKIIVFVITLCMIAGCSSLKPDEAVKNTPADNTDSNTHAGSAADKPATPGEKESALKSDGIVKNNTAGNTDSNGSNTQKTLTKLIPTAIPAAIIAGVVIVYYAYKVFCRGNIKGAEQAEAVIVKEEGIKEEPPVQGEKGKGMESVPEKLEEEEKGREEVQEHSPVQEIPAPQQLPAEGNELKTWCIIIAPERSLTREEVAEAVNRREDFKRNEEEIDIGMRKWFEANSLETTYAKTKFTLKADLFTKEFTLFIIKKFPSNFELRQIIYIYILIENKDYMLILIDKASNKVQLGGEAFKSIRLLTIRSSKYPSADDIKIEHDNSFPLLTRLIRILRVDKEEVEEEEEI